VFVCGLDTTKAYNFMFMPKVEKNWYTPNRLAARMPLLIFVSFCI